MNTQNTETDGYYYLESGDLIKEGDEIDACNDGWRDKAKWKVATNCIGQKAPNPRYPSHRKYRRKIKI